MKNIYRFTTLLLLSLMPLFASAQKSDVIDIKFVNARFTDTLYPGDVIVAFLVTTRDSSDFPPQINIPPPCTVFENGMEKKVLLSPHNLSVALHGSDVKQRSPETYNLIKGKVDLDNMKTGLIMTFMIADIPYSFTRMTMTPIFTEKKEKQRVSTRFEFSVN